MARRRVVRALPLSAVLVVVAVGLLLVAAGHWRRGAGVLAVAAGVAAALRLVVRDRSIGPLAVRSRAFDVVFLIAVAAVLVFGTTVGVS